MQKAYETMAAQMTIHGLFGLEFSDWNEKSSPKKQTENALQKLGKCSFTMKY